MIPIVRRSLAISLLSVYSCSVCYVAAEPGDKTTKGNTPDQDHVTTIVGDRDFLRLQCIALEKYG